MFKVVTLSLSFNISQSSLPKQVMHPHFAVFVFHLYERICIHYSQQLHTPDSLYRIFIMIFIINETVVFLELF